MPSLETFEAMLAGGQDGEMLRYTLGKMYWEQKMPDRAIPHLQQAVVFKPDYSTAWKILGRALFDCERYSEAKDAYTSGLDAAGKNGDKQTEKEMTVFLKRVEKALAAEVLATKDEQT